MSKIKNLKMYLRKIWWQTKTNHTKKQINSWGEEILEVHLSRKQFEEFIMVFTPVQSRDHVENYFSSDKKITFAYFYAANNDIYEGDITHYTSVWVSWSKWVLWSQKLYAFCPRKLDEEELLVGRTINPNKLSDEQILEKLYHYLYKHCVLPENEKVYLRLSGGDQGNLMHHKSQSKFLIRIINE